MKKILILCSGNSCRSHMAEAYLKFYTNNQVDVYSAGLQANALHLFAQTVMAEDGLNISAYTSENLKKWKGIQFDYLISVCGELGKEVLEIFPEVHYVPWLFLDPDLEEGTKESKLNTFRTVREDIKTHVLQFIGNELDIIKSSPLKIS